MSENRFQKKPIFKIHRFLILSVLICKFGLLMILKQLVETLLCSGALKESARAIAINSLKGVTVYDSAVYPDGVAGISFAGGSLIHIIGSSFNESPNGNTVQFTTSDLGSTEITFTGPPLSSKSCSSF